MPNVKSAKKRVKTNERDAARNRVVRSSLRTAVGKTRKALEAGDAGAVKSSLPGALKAIGRSAKKGVIPKKRASRLESRLTKAANKAAAQA